MFNDHVFIIADECLALSQPANELGNNIAQALIVQLRGAGTAPVICTQQPSRLDPAAKSNLAVVCTLRNQAQEIPAVALIQQLTPEQRQRVFGLATGEGAVTVAGRLPFPVIIRTPKYPNDPASVSEAELRELSQRSVNDLADRVKKSQISEPASTAVEKPQRDADRVSADAELLLRRYESKPMVMRLVAEDLKWSSSKVSRAVRELRQAGIWSEGPEFGHGNKQYLLTDRGRQYCERWRIPLAREKSGRPHDRTHQIVVDSTERIVAQRVPGARFQARATYQVGPNKQVQADRLIIGPGRDGLRVALQTAHHNTVQYEVTNLVRLGGMDGALGPHVILCVASSAAHKDALQRGLERLLAAVQSRDGSGEWAEQVRARIRLTHIDEVLAATFDLSWLSGGAA